MKTQNLTFALLLGVALGAGCNGNATSHRAYAADGGSSPVRTDTDDDDEEEGEESIALDAVPEVVRAAALARLPGLVIVRAERETENGAVVYSLEGTLDGERREIEISAAGAVLEVESGADDEDDDD